MSDRRAESSRQSYLRSAQALIEAGLIERDAAATIAAVGRRYAVSISKELAGLINRADPADPIARQFVPDGQELSHQGHERADPIGDLAHQPAAGIVHRYPDRVLLQPLRACPVYCRFCFRRESVGPGADQMLDTAGLDRAFAYIASHEEIWEVILTGGDPLGLSPRRLHDLMARLKPIPHVKVLRVHTRVPVVDSSRVGPAMIAALKASGKTVYVALHANHPRELTPQAACACAMFIEAGIPMVSQSVLLRGVNDDAEILAALMRRFVELRIKPYYLHHPDLAPGTGHFRLTIGEGERLVAQLRGRLSGLAQPQYVIDIPGGHGKSPLGRNYVAPEPGGGYTITDWQGSDHVYRDDRAAARGVARAGGSHGSTGAAGMDRPSHRRRA